MYKCTSTEMYFAENIFWGLVSKYWKGFSHKIMQTWSVAYERRSNSVDRSLSDNIYEFLIILTDILTILQRKNTRCVLLKIQPRLIG